MKKIIPVCALLLTALMAGAQSDDGAARPTDKNRGAAERFEHRRGGDAGFARGDWLERLKSENPEEFERLQKMREEDPEAFREEMRARMKKRATGFVKQHGGKLDAEAKTLGEKYARAESEAEKAAIKAELETTVYQAFDSRLDAQKKVIAHLEKQLERLKQQVADREKNREAICRDRVDTLTGDPNLRW
ncbi:MAG: hypothetical protein RRC34_00815 [Lentisphaeria bacterium]|nr:hypothetical protein [Lentisphaeria bacterium]